MLNDSATSISPDMPGVLEDFVDIVHAPAEVFERRRGAGFWTPLLTLAVIMSILTFSTWRILAPAIEADEEREVQVMQRDNPGMDVAAGERLMESAGDFFALAGGLFAAMGILAQGFFLWVAGKLAGSKINGRSAVLIATYAWVPALIGGLVTLIEGLLRGPASLDGLSRLSWGPARFMDPDANWELVQFIATEVDLFTIWWAALAAIGLSVIGNMPRARAASIVGLLYVAMAVPGLIGLLNS